MTILCCEREKGTVCRQGLIGAKPVACRSGAFALHTLGRTDGSCSGLRPTQVRLSAARVVPRSTRSHQCAPSPWTACSQVRTNDVQVQARHRALALAPSHPGLHVASGPVMQQSFAEFCKRPENRPAVEEAQRQEMKQALRLKETMQWLEFEKKVRLAQQSHWLRA